jgi:hypothetical protein
MATPTTLPASLVAGTVLTAAQLNDLRGAFRIMQVVQTVKTDTFSTTSATFTNVTGLTATITPAFTDSKILIIAMVNFSTSIVANNGAAFRIDGGNATGFVGDTAGNRIRAALWSTNQTNFAPANSMLPGNIVYLDSPATTSATTYAIQARIANSGTAFVNRSGTDTDSDVYGRTASSITVMEISA